MQRKTDILLSFIITFTLFICGVLYYNYVQSHQKQATKDVFDAITALSKKGIEVGYKDLKTNKNPTFINFNTKDAEFIGVDINILAKTAEIKIKNNNNGYQANFNNVEIGADYNISKITIDELNKNFKITLQNIDIKGIKFDKLEAVAKYIDGFLEVDQLVLEANGLSIIAQGSCNLKYSNDFDCKFNTSSTGVLDLLNQLDEKDIFTSRGVYVTNLVLRSQGGKRIIAPVEFNAKGFYIKNILMTSEKNIDN